MYQRRLFILHFRIISYLHFSAKDSHYNLEGLKPNTFYHVRSKSRNKAGLSDASNIIYLHTSGLNAIPRIGPFPNSSTSVSTPSVDRTFKLVFLMMSLNIIHRRWCVTNCLQSPFVREMEHAILMWYFEDISLVKKWDVTINIWSMVKNSR